MQSPAAVDPIQRVLAYPSLRRLTRLLLFFGTLVVFRRLLILLVFFVAFERSLGGLSRLLSERARIPRKAALGVVALGLLAALGVAGVFGAGKALQAWHDLRDALPERIEAFKTSALYHQLQERLGDAGKLVENAQHFAKDAVEYLALVGHVTLFAIIGFILAVVYLLEREELDHFAASQDRASLPGTMMRWAGHLADAISVTLQFQLVVAAVNAVLTFPVLLIVGIPHATAYLFMVFFSGMVPVVGNFVAGLVLTVLAYQADGWTGVGIFTVLTFVLHKVESYYLNPRLAARHVRLPGFVLIVSLLLWEQLVGFVGLFISFPFLYLANRLRDELRAEDAPAPVATQAPHDGAQGERATG